MKPSLFISCSREQRSIADAVQQELDDDLEITIWHQNIFSPSSIVIDDLIRSLPSFDFGLFIFAPDDILSKRGNTSAAPRDNIVFELGMFMARLGRERCFILSPKGIPLSIPTDLLGITTLRYTADRSDANFRASVGPACVQIRNYAETYGPSQLPTRPLAEVLPVSQLTTLERGKIEGTIHRLANTGSGATSLVYVDIDRFDALNRYYGEETCDRVIVAIEEILRANCPSDFQVRMGGDQFLLCRKNTTVAEGMSLAHECVEAVKNWNWPIISPNLYVTIGVGVAAFVTGEAPNRWIVRCIHGCISAKKQGGNTVKEAPVTLSKKASLNYVDMMS